MTKKYVSFGVVLFALLLAGCWEHPEQPPNPDQLISRGETVYWEYCSECHQRDGSGWSDLYPRLDGNPIVTLHDPEPAINTILFGQGAMPAFQDVLNPDDLAAVLSYIRNAWSNRASTVSPRQMH